MSPSMSFPRGLRRVALRAAARVPSLSWLLVCALALCSSIWLTWAQAATPLSLQVRGRQLIDGQGAVVQLRGVNYSGYEFAAVQGWSGSDPSGAQAGVAGGPDLNALKAWKANALRVPLNAASWLGTRCVDTDGKAHNPDPAGNYRASVQSLVSRANAAGLYVILDLHWTAPGAYCPLLQTQMADADHALSFWASVARLFKGNPAVIFELYKEPYFNFDFSGDAWATMMKGTSGQFSGFPATSGSGHWVNVARPWKVASYQAMIHVVRAAGARNVVLVGGMQYAQDLSGWLANRPVDPLNQMAAAWHPYRLYHSSWDYPYPNFYPQVFTDALAILNAGIPLVMTEIGGQNTPGTPSCPICDTVTAFADAQGVGVLARTWDLWGDPETVLVRDASGTPIDGQGVAFRNWLLAH